MGGTSTTDMPRVSKRLSPLFRPSPDRARADGRRGLLKTCSTTPAWYSSPPSGERPRFVRPEAALDLNSGILRLSTLLRGLAGAGNDFRLDLASSNAAVRCSQDDLAVAMFEAVSQARTLLAGSGTIVIRTRLIGHHVFLIVAAREDGAAAFRFGSLRLPPLPQTADCFAAARRLATTCHGRSCQRGAATLALKLPTVLSLSVRNRRDHVPPPLPPKKESCHENRQPVAA